MNLIGTHRLDLGPLSWSGTWFLLTVGGTVATLILSYHCKCLRAVGWEIIREDWGIFFLVFNLTSRSGRQFFKYPHAIQVTFYIWLLSGTRVIQIVCTSQNPTVRHWVFKCTTEYSYICMECIAQNKIHYANNHLETKTLITHKQRGISKKHQKTGLPKWYKYHQKLSTWSIIKYRNFCYFAFPSFF